MFFSYSRGPRYTPTKTEMKEYSLLDQRRIMLMSHRETIWGEFLGFFTPFEMAWHYKLPVLLWIGLTILLPSSIIYTMWLTIVPALLFELRQIIFFTSTLIGCLYIMLFGIAGWNFFYWSKYDKETYYDLIKIF